ncbi:hypothetical protein [Flavobacterium gelatinilyticum]|uniref:hypothetical protein n=1 Tax=Flavobacterium gelatinilyticum TaxID=3003260 RepID=UPI0024816EF2|nr:hypothetical protein [Flavobacterium gelatinilyticum]
MKKYACLLVLALLLNGCDDGDLTVDTIDFDSVQTASTCDKTTNALIYKLKSQESLLIQLPQNTIENNPSDVGSPRQYTIDNTNYRVVYRAYNGAVATANICGVIPPSTPVVTAEWQASGGIIEIVTTQDLGDPSATDGGTRIRGYNHVITFKNITYQKPGTPQTYVEEDFGTFRTDPENLNFTFAETAKQCSDKKNVYNFNTTSYMMVDNLDPTLIVKEEGTRSANITTTTNKLAYTTFKSGTGTLTESYFCQSPVPSAPNVFGTWESSPATQGTIEVTTTKAGTTNIIYTHTITLKNVTLKKDNSNFYLANSFLLGTITETSTAQKK